MRTRTLHVGACGECGHEGAFQPAGPPRPDAESFRYRCPRCRCLLGCLVPTVAERARRAADLRAAKGHVPTETAPCPAHPA